MYPYFCRTIYSFIYLFFRNCFFNLAILAHKNLAALDTFHIDLSIGLVKVYRYERILIAGLLFKLLV